jgi:2-octaprenyl-6-methoxyphenol hydroxylase
MQLTDYDATIIGAGPVGLMLAIGLAKKGKKIAIVEKEAPQQSPSFDGRVLALTHGSMLVLEELGLWSGLKSSTTAIKHVHVSQKGYLGITQIHAAEMQVVALGYSITGEDLGKVLWLEALGNSNITLYSKAILDSFTIDEDKVSLSIEKDGELINITSQLIVGADGTKSKVREILAIDIREKSYDAFAVIAKIETEQNPQGWSYERFTTEGPVALLPMFDYFHKAVMVVPADKIAEVKSYTDQKFIEVFTEKMGERLGEFVSVSNRVSYPLVESYAEQMIAKRSLLIGNASHTQHPVAAQGLNLGISDIAVFLDLVADDLGAREALQEYEQQRQPVHEKIMGFTDSLIQIFETKSSIIGHLRGIGLMAMEAMPTVRKKLAKMAMGL